MSYQYEIFEVLCILKISESEDKFVDGTYQSDENLLNNISTLNKHGA